MYRWYMYINLILGAVAIGVVWFYLRKLFVKPGELSSSPAELLESELERRREKEREATQAFERLRDAARQRVALVASALQEVRAAMPEEAAGRLSWTEEDDSLVIQMHGKDGTPASCTVLWKIPDLDLRAAAKHAREMPGEYVLRFATPGGEERATSLDACMRRITSFIVDLME
ncbi:MAG: hypothetical protein DELT_01415 [Desulfovibrio sp.]